MIRLSLLGISLLILQSCGGNNGAGFGRVESPMWHSTASAEVKRSYFRSQCLDFGFTDKRLDDTLVQGSALDIRHNAAQCYRN